MGRASLLTTACVAAAVAWSSAAGAICGRPADASMTPLPVGAPAPVNAQITLSLPSTWRTRTFCEDAPRACVEGSFDLVLREAPGRRAGSVVVIPTTTVEASLGRSSAIVMKPLAPLAKRTRYEVVRVERTAKVPPTVVGTFATGDAADVAAPSWAGITRHRVSSSGPTTRGGVVTVAEECAANEVQLVADAAAADDATPASAIRYAVWFADEGASIDYASPPRAIVAGHRVPTTGGRSELVLVVQLDHDGKLALPNGKWKAKIGVRALDAAGNPSAPSETTVGLP